MNVCRTESLTSYLKAWAGSAEKSAQDGVVEALPGSGKTFEMAEVPRLHIERKRE